MVRALARKAKVSGSKPGEDTFLSVGDNLIKLELHT